MKTLKKIPLAMLIGVAMAACSADEIKPQAAKNPSAIINDYQPIKDQKEYDVIPNNSMRRSVNDNSSFIKNKYNSLIIRHLRK
jgi:hypothetical protein